MSGTPAPTCDAGAPGPPELAAGWDEPPAAARMLPDAASARDPGSAGSDRKQILLPMFYHDVNYYFFFKKKEGKS